MAINLVKDLDELSQELASIGKAVEGLSASDNWTPQDCRVAESLMTRMLYALNQVRLLRDCLSCDPEMVALCDGLISSIPDFLRALKEHHEAYMARAA